MTTLYIIICVVWSAALSITYSAWRRHQLKKHPLYYLHLLGKKLGEADEGSKK